MRIVKHGFGILLENEITYFGHLEGIISSVDELAEAEINKSVEHYTVRIVPSTPAYSQPLLRTLLDFHNLLGIRLDLSKSIKKNSTIAFTIPII